MKKVAKIFTAIAVLLSIPLSAQIRNGRYSLANPSAPMLSASIGSGGYWAVFLARVGGVAFDQTARPAAGFEPRSVILKYTDIPFRGWMLRHYERLGAPNERPIRRLYQL
jgi:hypothetical protein